MVWSLFLLILMGQCSFFTCQLYEYHFINEKKTWNEAKKYCKEHYTDLATVTNMADVERLHDERHQDEAWIGLSKTEERKKMWHWTLTGFEFIVKQQEWHENEPNNENGFENCVRIENREGTIKLNDGKCDDRYRFICFNETEQSNKTYHLVEKEKTWRQAQSYCRENYTDLVSGLDQLEEVKEKVNMTRPNNKLWLGLFGDYWKWSDGRNFTFRNWDLKTFKDEESNKKCATVLKNGRWTSADCNETKHFFCYYDKVILIKEEKTWPEALDYCRAHHSDLVSITDRHQQRWVEKKVQNATTDFVWLGLRYSCTLDFWFWVSDEKVSYKNWYTTRTTDDCNMSAAMKKGGEHKWFTKKDDEKFHFLCAVC